MVGRVASDLGSVSHGFDLSGPRCVLVTLLARRHPSIRWVGSAELTVPIPTRGVSAAETHFLDFQGFSYHFYLPLPLLGFVVPFINRRGVRASLSGLVPMTRGPRGTHSLPFLFYPPGHLSSLSGCTPGCEISERKSRQANHG